MEHETCLPSTSTSTGGSSSECKPSTSFSRADKKDDESDVNGEFYFESEHLALKGNKDYLNLLKTIALLEAQRTKSIEDYDTLLSIQEEAMKDPMTFLEKLQRGEDLGIPSPQVIAEIPNIDWSAYNVTFPAEFIRPQTRKTTIKHSEPDPIGGDLKSKVLVRGRIFDDSKPETFNQLWTAEEQRRLEELLVEYPPEEVETRRWRKIAAALGNRTTKQVCSRVQKYFIKLHKAGLPVPGRSPKLPEISRRGPTYSYKHHFNHRHQRYNHFLYRQTTFFPQQDVPVYMSDFDDDTFGSCPPPNSDLDMKMEDDKEDRLSDDDKLESNTVEYQHLALLRRVKKEKERETGRKPAEHYGFQCDVCKQDPLLGTRWHCLDCPQSISIDFCTDCVVTQLESSKSHPISHRLIELRDPQNSMDGWDQYYKPHSFSVQPDRYNYLDPNFMPD